MDDFIAAVVLFTLAFALGTYVGHNEQSKLQAECEKTLPRNQHCILRAEQAPQPVRNRDE